MTRIIEYKLEYVVALFLEDRPVIAVWQVVIEYLLNDCPDDALGLAILEPILHQDLGLAV
ncbi:hypothetical protein D3C81_2072700 [compost metagenome]